MHADGTSASGISVYQSTGYIIYGEKARELIKIMNAWRTLAQSAY